MKKIIPYAILGLAALGRTQSAGDVLDEMTVITTSSKTAERQETAVEKVIVVDRKDIEASGAKNMEEVLRNIPGVVITHHPMAKVAIQGFDGDYVKVMIDGVEVAGNVGGAVPVNLISTADIEQVEVLKGAASALYGSDAMGGVINIITRKHKARGFKGDVTQTVYSNERMTGQINAGYGWDKLSLQVGGFYDHDDGRSADWVTALDDTVAIYPLPIVEQEGASARLQWQGERSKAAVYGNWQQAVRTSSGSSGMETQFNDDGYNAGAEWERGLGQSALLSMNANLKNFTHSTQQTNLTFNNKLPKSTADFRDYEAETKLGMELHSWHSLLVGVNATLRTMDGDDFSEERRTSNIDVFVQDAIHVGGEDRLQIVPGIRFSNQLALGEEPFDLTPTPKLSMRYAPDTTKIFRLSYGMGYKRPTLKQKYWMFFHAAPANFMLLGNPDLKPEKSHGFNGSAEWKPLPGLRLSASAYANYIFNLITTEIIDENEGSIKDLSGNLRNYIYIRTYVNKDKAITTGGDLSADYRLHGYDLGASYTHLRAMSKVEGKYEDIAGKSRHSARARLGKSWQTGTMVSNQVTWNGPQLYSQADDTYSPDYFRWDASASQKIGKFVTLSVGVQNILDNLNFKDGDYAENAVNQENYYGLYDGRIYYASLQLHY